MREERQYLSTYSKVGGPCFKDSFVINQALVFQIKIYYESSALRLAAKP
jgi:hypothetical protein